MDSNTNPRFDQLRIGIPLTLLSGAYMTVNALASGKISWRDEGDILRASAPFEFWLTVLVMAVITVFGTHLAVRYREAIWGSWESYRGKTFRYLGLFCFLAVIYSIYLSMHVKASPDDALLGSLAKLCLISAFPFAVLVYSDKAWNSNDAALVCASAWIAVCAGFSYKCPICAFGLAFLFFPFVLSALLAHGLGTLCRFLRHGNMKSVYGA